MIEQHGSLAEKFLKKWVWLYLFSFIIGPIGYIIKIIISGELSVSEVWILYGIMSLMILISAYNDLWLTDSLNFFIPKYISESRYDKVKTILTYTLIAQFLTGISIACFFFFAADFIATSYFKDIAAIGALKAFAFFFLGINMFQMIHTFFLAIQNTLLHKLVELIRMWFVLISTLIFFFLDMKTLTYFSYSWIIGLYLWIIVSSFLFFRKYYLPYLKNVKVIWDKELFREIFLYSLSVFLWIQASVILSQIDMQMILYILGTQDAWYYTNYQSIIGIPFLIIWPIFAFLFPLFSELASKKQFDKIRLVKEIFQNNFIVIAFACSIFFFVFSKDIVYVLFWEKFLPSGDILQYSILFLCFNFLLHVNFSIMAGIGKVRERVYIVLIAIFCNIILNLIGIHYFWVSGAALATGIGWLIIVILSEYYLWKDYRIWFEIKFIGKNILILTWLGFVLYMFIQPLLVWFTRIESFLSLLCIGAIFFCIFSLMHINYYKILYKEIKNLKRT